MAQAPEGGINSAGAPRQNKTVKQFSGMNTQNRRNAIPEGSFAWLENIQPVGPGHLHSIPGRSFQLTLIPPFIPPVHPCIPVAPDGINELDILFEAGVGPSNHYSWAFVEPTMAGETVYMAATNSPFPDNQQMYKSVNGTTTTETFPTGINSLSNLVPGTADSVMFAQATGGGFYLWDLANGSQVTMVLGGHGFSGSNVRNWTVNGNLCFLGGDDITDGVFGIPVIAKFNAVTGAFISYILLPAGNVHTFHYDGEFVYVLYNTNVTDYFINRYDTDLVLDSTFALNATNINEPYMGAYNIGDFTYVMKRRFGTMGIAVAVSYVDDMTSQVVLDEDVPGSGISVDASPGVLWVMNDEVNDLKYLYFGKGLGANIYKFGPIECAS